MAYFNNDNKQGPFAERNRTSQSEDVRDSNQPPSNSNQIQIPSISLPKGGGALKNIDEKFEVNAVNGTAGFSVPLPFSKTRSDFIPAVTLSYNSGSGNSEFGLGWNLGFSSIQRKTDKKLPEYKDAEESDVFMFTGVEDLVPVIINDGNGNWSKDEFDAATGDKIKRYRPRIEGTFSRIERITPAGESFFYWKVTSRSNVVTIYGRAASARISNPQDADQIFKWLPEFSYDDKANCFELEYVQDCFYDENTGRGDFKNVPITLSEGNRRNGNARCTNVYLKRIRYGNKNPYFPAQAVPFNPYDPVPPSDPSWPKIQKYFFETVFDYGDENIATSEPQQDWSCRLDPFSEYKPGFEIRTYRLCRRILFFHTFKELNGGDSTLVRSLDLSYRYLNNLSATSEEVRNAEADYIIAVSQSGYIKNPSGDYSKKSLPPVDFTYQELDWNKTIQEISPENIVNAPVGLGNNYQWVDLWSEGISGILTEQADAWYYKSNLGDGNFSIAEPVIPKPSFNGLSNGTLQLQDLEADGRKFVVSTQGPVKGYFELSDDDEWQPFIAFDQMPNINFNDPNVKFIDLNGDGKADLIISEENVFLWYPNEGAAGYDSPELAAKPFDEEQGPALVFADPTQSIYLADMSSDGMTDIVRIRNGEVCYWPNLGYGKFGAKMSMDNAPVFDLPEQFNAAYLHLSDVSGTGATDILYLGKNQFNAWLNLSGNGWSEVKDIDPFPSTESPNQLSVVDLLGNGTACIVWSSPLPQYANIPMRYIDLMGGKKPYIMSGYKNNFGKETSWEYKSSTYYYLQDKLAGTPWVTKLPFPVQCVEKVSINDLVSGTFFTNSYTYHHGYYDHPEREFRGFGRVEQTDTEDFENFKLSGASNVVEHEDLHQPPVKTITWFHTGAYFNEQNILNHFSDEYNVGSFEFELPQPVLPEGLTAIECREALRACKGMMLRQEVYSPDESTEALNPYSVAKHNNLIKLLQPKLDNGFTVFYVHESEAATFYYERNMGDPRIAHTLNLEVDNFGNVLKSASVVYGRKTTDSQLPLEIQDEQRAVHVIFTENDFTNDFDLPDVYRLKSVAETKTYELTNNNQADGYYTKSQFSIDDLLTDFSAAAEINYEESPGNTLQKRLIEDVQVIYLANDLITPLSLGQIESLAFGYQSYKLALIPSLVSTRYDGRVTDQMLIEAKYIQQDGINWWISSGRNVYLNNGEMVAVAQQRFYLPLAAKDPFDVETKLFYDDYLLLLIRTEDALQNTASAEAIDYRTLQPTILKDLNNNFSEIIADELGMVITTSVYGDEGDGNHGDLPLNNYQVSLPADLGTVMNDPLMYLQQATTFFYYDLFAWMNRNQPVCFASVVRETHVSELTNGEQTRVFLSVGHTSGLGQNLQTKVQAEPGDALKWSNGTLETIQDVNPRWAGSGRTILNNKGNPIKQYEPFFSTTYEYESEDALVQIGFSSILQYDPLGRTIRVDHPNGTLSRIEFDAWKQLSFDENDSVLESAWYSDRGSPNPLSPEPTDPETRAAWLTAKHANTPSQAHLDSLGRTIYTIADNGIADDPVEGTIDTRVVLDIENNQREVIDARGNNVMKYEYNMISQKVLQISMDAGERWTFTDALGKPSYSWDSRNHRFRTEYDALHRPTNQWLLEDIANDPANEKLIGVIVYGENQSEQNGNQIFSDIQLNLRGKPFQSYDQSGLVQTSEYDFKGNVKRSFKQLAKEYKQVFDYNVADKSIRIDITESFNSSSKFDATNKPVEMVLPDSSKVMPVYNEANLLEQLNVFIQSQDTTVGFVQSIEYNAKAQRESIVYGNNTSTTYTYDERTYRLIRLLTTRNKGVDRMQDLNYTYDPVGNITEIIDNAVQTIYFNNAAVDPSNKFEYDAIYRLTKALGREHAGQNAASDQFDTDKTQDGNGQRLVLPGDMNAMQNYEQQYVYDKVGNMLQMIHNAGLGIFSNKWARLFTPNTSNNQLLNTTVGAVTTKYSYDAHGNILNLQNGSFNLVWNYADQLQQIDLGGGGTAYYIYDASGQRVRKVIENGGSVKDRIYLSAYEVYREKQNGSLELERETLHVMDDKNRIALIEALMEGTDKSSPFLIRYQYSNHLGTSCLELSGTLDSEDDTFIAEIISYEEYYPFGSTSYQATRSQTETPKRYRYTGKERDEESGLYYHGARYYAPWLVRWSSADFEGLVDGNNLYVYVRDNPIILHDPNGRQAKSGTVDYSIMTMTDSQLHDRMLAVSKASPELLGRFIRSATGKFRTRVEAMQSKYGMSVMYSSSKATSAGEQIREGTTTVEHIRPRPTREDMEESVPLFSFFFKVPMAYARPYQAPPPGSPVGLLALRQLNGQPALAVANFSRDYAPGSSIESLTGHVMGVISGTVGPIAAMGGDSARATMQAEVYSLRLARAANAGAGFETAESVTRDIAAISTRSIPVNGTVNIGGYNNKSI